MELVKTEEAFVARVANEVEGREIVELSELQLAFVGGGCGEITPY
jgi:hypothetical protein